MQRTRTGPTIRQFLEYYLLVLLSEKSRSKRQMVEEIRQRSAGNRSYRSNGVLWPASAEMDTVLARLAANGLVKPPGRGARWRITVDGEKALAAYGDGKEDTDGKNRAADRLIERIEPVFPNTRVLDVGTGQGFLALKLAERGFSVVGIDSGCFDYSRDSLQKAREQSGEHGRAVEFQQADVREFDAPDESFDYVVSSQAVHCMSDQRGCVEAAHRLLKPGGRLLCIDYLVSVLGFQRHGFHCFLALTREEWVEMLLERRFVNIRMHEMDDFILIEAQKPSSVRVGDWAP
jgi:ubiquinone/menaquinone biosynthesis C-methylase UbiE